MASTSARLLPALTTLLLCAGLTIGCGSGEPPASTAESSRPAAPATDAASPATVPPAIPPSETGAAAAADPAGQTRSHEIAGVEVTLVEAARTSGDTVTVRWRWRNTTAETVQLAKGSSGWYDPYLVTGDAYLIDPVNKKKYLVLTDSERVPIASRHRGNFGIDLAAGATMNSWAKFPAPPADVDAITVFLPGVEPFEAVPLKR
ncbi:MAG: hypothetical protein AB1806_07790 [Acidobacteriota bacterium]